jgi:hypothetical protein
MTWTREEAVALLRRAHRELGIARDGDRKLREYYLWRVECDTRTLIRQAGYEGCYGCLSCEGCDHRDPEVVEMFENADLVRVIAKYLSLPHLEELHRKLHEAVAEGRALICEAIKNGEMENPYA